MRKLKQYFWNLLLGFDQLFNVLLGGLPDEIISSRCHRKAKAGQWFWKFLSKIVDKIFFWDKRHCLESFENEKRGEHLPEELRG